ncbi:hypothetical protein VPHD249_0209 [Vibrio phage D249]
MPIPRRARYVICVTLLKSHVFGRLGQISAQTPEIYKSYKNTPFCEQMG